MSAASVSEQQILEALRRVPVQRWGDVLNYLDSLHSIEQGVAGPKTVRTAADLIKSELVGLWAERTDLGDSRTFARKLREQAEQRAGTNDAARH